MNIWTKKSIELANQSNYLDLLFKVYPMSVNLRRELDVETQNKIISYLDKKDNNSLIDCLLDEEIFPIKDSYVAYLKKDRTAIIRNPNTVARLAGTLYEMGADEIFDKMTLPKETNRQIGPLFRNWFSNGSLGCEVTDSEDEFLNKPENMVLNGTDEKLKEFASRHLGYTHDKGLDLVAKFNNCFILSEAKFLTDFGGHQNAQFKDAISTLESNLDKTQYNVRIIAILDGVVYIKSRNKMHLQISGYSDESKVIISAVLLRDYLYSL